MQSFQKIGNARIEVVCANLVWSHYISALKWHMLMPFQTLSLSTKHLLFSGRLGRQRLGN